MTNINYNIKKLYNYAISVNEQQPFHLVRPSPWPIMTALSLWSLALSFLGYSHCSYCGYLLPLFFIAILVLSLTCWFYTISVEALEGQHVYKVRQNIYLGMLLFIISELMFFFSFFWAFFHFSLSPSIWLGGIWPPLGIPFIDLFGFPFYNTLVLLSSGYFITLSHLCLKINYLMYSIKWMAQTTILGLHFIFMQSVEYGLCPFSINDSVYGSIFYITTGFHGFHVFFGSLFLGVCTLRTILRHMSQLRHVGLVCAIWYWHFVDVIWIFLYFCIYIWA